MKATFCAHHGHTHLQGYLSGCIDSIARISSIKISQKENTQKMQICAVLSDFGSNSHVEFCSREETKSD